MLVLSALALLGLLQSLFAAARYRGQWLPTLLYCIVPGLLIYILFPWVEQTNVNQLTDRLTSGTLATSIAALLILEAALKIICLIDRGDEAPQSMHCIQRSLRSLTKQGELVLRHSPSITFLFFLFYGQAWVFHTIEGISFKSLSICLCVGFSTIFTLSTLLIRKVSTSRYFDATTYDLQFIQFVIAVGLPLLTKESHTAPMVYDNSIYLQAVSTGVVMLITSTLGYTAYRYFKYRTQTK